MCVLFRHGFCSQQPHAVSDWRMFDLKFWSQIFFSSAVPWSIRRLLIMLLYIFWIYNVNLSKVEGFCAWMWRLCVFVFMYNLGHCLTCPIVRFFFLSHNTFSFWAPQLHTHLHTPPVWIWLWKKKKKKRMCPKFHA